MNNKKQINDNIVIDQNQLLGRGSTGNVYLGYSLKNQNIKYAVKAIDLKQVNNEVTQYLLSCQIAALSQLAKLKVNSIVKLQDIGFQQNYCYLVMELLKGGPLSQYIKLNPEGLTQNQCIHLFKQMFEGYKAIKNLGIVHRDIKPDNLIFRYIYDQGTNYNDEQKSICYIDFGYCTMERVLNRPKAYYNVGSPKYMSPQAFRQNIYSQKSDIWALGVILYEMLHGRTIDTGMQMSEYIEFMRNNPIPLTNNVSPLIKKLLLGLLTFDYRKRISCQAIQQILKGNLNKCDEQNYQQLNKFQNIAPLNFNTNKKNIYHNQVQQSGPINSNRSFPHSHNIIIVENNQFIDKRVERQYSNQNKFRQYNNSPRKIIHLQNNFSTSSQPAVQNSFPMHFSNSNFSNIQKKSFIQQERIKIIQQQNLNQITSKRNNKILSNLNVNNQYNIKRIFLRSVTQNQTQQFPLKHFNPPQFFVHPPSPMKNQIKKNQVFRSQIFSNHLHHNGQINKKVNMFYASQISQNPLNDIKIITSDKVLQNRQLQNISEQSPNKHLFKSYSTNNAQINIQKKQNLFTPPSFIINHQNRQPLNNNYINRMRPVERLILQKQIPNMRGFLRNAIPVHKSIIQNPNFNFIDNNKLPQNSNNALDKKLIQNNQNTNYKNNDHYFRGNQTEKQKFKPQRISFNISTSPFNIQNQNNSQQNRQYKSCSVKNISESKPFQNSLIKKTGIQYQSNVINNNPIIPMRQYIHKNNQEIFQPIHNKSIELTRQQNINFNRNYHSNQNQNPSNYNHLSRQIIRKSIMIEQQPQRQGRIPTFILSNQQQRNVYQNKNNQLFHNQIYSNQNQHQNMQTNYQQGNAFLINNQRVIQKHIPPLQPSPNQNIQFNNSINSPFIQNNKNGNSNNFSGPLWTRYNIQNNSIINHSTHYENSSNQRRLLDQRNIMQIQNNKFPFHYQQQPIFRQFRHTVPLPVQQIRFYNR